VKKLWTGEHLEVRETEGSSYYYNGRTEYVTAEIFLCQRNAPDRHHGDTVILHRNDAEDSSVEKGLYTSNGRISKAKREKAVARGKLIDSLYHIVKAARILAGWHRHWGYEVRNEAHNAYQAAREAMETAALEGDDTALITAAAEFRAATRQKEDAAVKHENHTAAEKNLDEIQRGIMRGKDMDAEWVLERFKELLPEEYDKMFPKTVTSSCRCRAWSERGPDS
jgi:hypothetical protein